jgi:hypothetical protein
MQHSVRTATVLLSLCLAFFSDAVASPPPANKFNDDWTGLFLAVTKSFGARTYYVGSDDHWSYFETKFEDSLFTPTYRRVEASRMHLPRTFPLWQGKPYRIELKNFAGYDNPQRQPGGA